MNPYEMLARAAPSVQLYTCTWPRMAAAAPLCTRTCRATPQPYPLSLRACLLRSSDPHAVRLRRLDHLWQAAPSAHIHAPLDPVGPWGLPGQDCDLPLFAFDLVCMCVGQQ